MRNDGGAAFPSNGYILDRQREEQRPYSELGASLRDYFAAAALQGLICSPAFIEAVKDVPEDRIPSGTAAAAYELADAMIAERDES